MNRIAEFIKANKTTVLAGFAIVVMLVMVFLLEGGEPQQQNNTAIKSTRKPERVEQTIAPSVSPEVSPSASPQVPVMTTMPLASPKATLIPESATAEPYIEEEENTVEAEMAEQEVRKTESKAKPDEREEIYSFDDAPEKEAALTAKQETEGNYCTIAIYADTLLENMDLLDRDKHSLVPENGCILPPVRIELEGGENVFDILQKATRENKIHMEFVNTPIYNSAYIEGINNLYEFDAGELSGWVYCVNEEFPNYGCSGYKVNNGDAIKWHYTCDLGRDVSGRMISQRDE